jgi:O-antigen ligase
MTETRATPAPAQPRALSGLGLGRVPPPPIPASVPLLFVIGSIGLGALAGAVPFIVLAAAAAIALVALILTNLALGLTVFVVIQFFAQLPYFGGGQEVTVVKATGGLLALSWILVAVRQRANGPRGASGDGLFAHHPALVVLLLLFLVWGGLSYLWAFDPSLVYNDLERYALNFLLFAIVFAAVRKPVHAVWIAGALALGTAVATLSSSFFGTSNDPSRLAGSIGDPNDFASALVPGIVLSVALAGTLRSRAWRSTFVAVALIGLVGLFLTASRGGLVGMGAALAVWIVIGGRWRIPLAAVVALTSAGALVYYATFAPEDLATRVTTTGDGSGRLDIWLLGWRVFEDRPWLGAGLNNYTTAIPQYLVEPGLVARADRIITTPKVAHNMYLSMLAELGMVGFVLFAGIIITSLVLMLRAVRVFAGVGNRAMDMISRAYVASLCGVLAADFFLTGQYAKHLWLLLGMGPALLLIARREAVVARRTLAAPAVPPDPPAPAANGAATRMPSRNVSPAPPPWRPVLPAPHRS